jgi:hypothetical protein
MGNVPIDMENDLSFIENTPFDLGNVPNGIIGIMEIISSSNAELL